MNAGLAARWEIPREALVAELLTRARDGGPLLLGGPPGSGKTTLLGHVGAALAAQGLRPVYLDLLGAVSTPERFVAAVLRALPADGFGARLGDAVAIRRLAGSGRLHGAEAVQALFDLLASTDTAADRRVVLVLDEATEIRSLAYFPGLRHADQRLAEALRARRGGTLLATSFPTLARRAWAFDELTLGPLDVDALAPALASMAHVDALELARVSFGWPRYVRALVEECARGVALATAWSAAMLPGGRLEQLCRATYETLLLRSRGYAACKAALAAVAYEPGLNLTALVARLGRTPGATRDYLHWLVGVDALRVERKRYGYVDGLLGLWVRLHAGGTLPDATTLQRAYAELLTAPAPATGDPGPREVTAAPEPAAQPVGNATPRHDLLMEID